MEIQVIMGDIRQHRKIKFNALEPVLVQPVRRRFQHRYLTSYSFGGGQNRLQIKDIERGHLLIVFDILVPDFDIRRAHHDGLGDVLIQYLMDQIHRSGFPVRSRHTDDEKFLGRIPVYHIRKLSVHLFPLMIYSAILEQEIDLIVHY